MRSHYLVLRRWVDRDLAHSHRPWSFVMPLTIIPIVIMLSVPDTNVGMRLVIETQLALLPWYAFVSWRLMRLFKAIDLKRDRRARGHNLLPPEYADSVSAATTAVQKRLQR